MTEPEQSTGRTYRLRYPGNVVAELQALPPDQPFAQNQRTGWPYRLISLDYSPAEDRTTLTLIPYPVEEYAAWLEGEAVKLASRRAYARVADR